ncbi:MAG TPA: MoxR family ATPase [Candidatus Paceibacterota bacterium]|nr:MoxR family ATPase [Candidatus Paceibacterota bacterium]
MKAVQAGLNVLLEGPYGVGKSSIIFAAAAQLGLRVKYFSAPTLDPFADLVGVPVPVMEDDKHRLLFLRPDFISEAEVLFFDELNRAHPKVINAVLEITQFRAINGEALPRLRSVVAAINPASAGYQVQDLDLSLLDRFHLHLRVAFGPSLDWFIQQFGERLGRALVEWYQADLDDKQRQAITNRRLEYIGRATVAGLDPADALPTEVKAPVHLLKARLREPETVLSIEQFVSDTEKLASAVADDFNVGLRFAQLLPMMKPSQKNRVRDLVLALPAELLAQLQSKTPFVFKKVREAVALYGSPDDARAYEELLTERLQVVA